MIHGEELRRALRALGDTLADRGETFHVAIVGGAALLLRGQSGRPTQDVDVVAVAAGGLPLRSRHQLPPELVDAAEDVAAVLDLDRDWLNAGALGVLHGRLPEGYEDRLEPEAFGNLTVSPLSRQDLIRLKLYAAADEGPASVHLHDLVRLSLTSDELGDARAWVEAQYATGPVPELQDVVELLERVVR